MPARTAPLRQDKTARDAAEFGVHTRQGGWRLGLLVARNVVVAPGRVPAESLFPKTNATEFARKSKTTTDRVIRYLNAWNRAADQNVVPQASTLTPGQEIDLVADDLPDWSLYYTSEPARQRRQTRTVAETVQDAARDGQAQAVVAAADAVADAATISADTQAAFQRDVEREALNARITAEREANARAEAEALAVADSEANARVIAHAGTTEQLRPKSNGTQSKTEARRMSDDLATEAANVIAAMQSYTRRMFDIARDPIWNSGGRDLAAERVTTMAKQLTMVAELIADPDSGRATDEALADLLNG